MRVLFVCLFFDGVYVFFGEEDVPFCPGVSVPVRRACVMCVGVLVLCVSLYKGCWFCVSCLKLCGDEAGLCIVFVGWGDA